GVGSETAAAGHDRAGGGASEAGAVLVVSGVARAPSSVRVGATRGLGRGHRGGAVGEGGRRGSSQDRRLVGSSGGDGAGLVAVVRGPSAAAAGLVHGVAGRYRSRSGAAGGDGHAVRGRGRGGVRRGCRSPVAVAAGRAGVAVGGGRRRCRRAVSWRRAGRDAGATPVRSDTGIAAAGSLRRIVSERWCEETTR